LSEIALPRIILPEDTEAKVRRAVRKGKKPGVVAVCFWCGHGYTKYSPELEDEHFAKVCLNAPETLKVQAVKRLGGVAIVASTLN
jgi:hypothetical protein